MADLEGELRALVSLLPCSMSSNLTVCVCVQGIGGVQAAVGALSTRAEDYSNVVSGTPSSSDQLHSRIHEGWFGAGVGCESCEICRDSFQGLVVLS